MTAAGLRPEPPSTHVALMVTRRCNMACGHCSVESGPQVRGEPAEATLRDWVRQAAGAGVRSIRITGGEPMLRDRVVRGLLRLCRDLGVVTTMTSNGFWGRTPGRAARHLRALRRAGLGGLTLSYDRYHAAFSGAGPILNIARAAEALGFPVSVTIVRGADDTELAGVVGALEGIPRTRLRFYDVQPVGRARSLAPGSLRQEVAGFCSACALPAITDDGRLVACNGPAYFAPPGSPLVVGSLAGAPLASLLERHRQDPVLDAIRTIGPAGLREELRLTPGFEAFPFRARYAGICDLCRHVTSDPAAVAALRERLAEPARAAARLAAWQVFDASRRAGALGGDHANGPGAARAFLAAAADPEGRWPPGSDKILGRADLDWRRWADYLGACGLARPLLPALEDRALARWAPRFFVETLRERALRDGLRVLAQAEALRRIADALAAVGTRAVLLKGAAVERLRLPGDSPSTRTTGDLDLYVDPPAAPALRAALLERGFADGGATPDGAPHHLAPVSLLGVPVEIHTGLAWPVWGLPEGEMLARARPLPGAAPYWTLDPEGLLLHTGVHASQHFFAQGLKTAWDVFWLLRASPGVDWDRLGRWIDVTRVPRAFWTPVRVLARELGLPLPDTFLRQAPPDGRQRRLEAIAHLRLFRAPEHMGLNGISRRALLLWLQDSWARRLGYLGREALRYGRHPRRWSGAARQGRDGLGEAWRHWRHYRRAATRPALSD